MINIKAEALMCLACLALSWFQRNQELKESRKISSVDSADSCSVAASNDFKMQAAYAEDEATEMCG